jgi:hypothetical protein
VIELDHHVEAPLALEHGADLVPDGDGLGGQIDVGDREAVARELGAVGLDAQVLKALELLHPCVRHARDAAHLLRIDWPSFRRVSRSGP